MSNRIYIAKPAPDDPRRCQAFLRIRKGRQCNRWALKGSKYCPFHGGRRKKLVFRDYKGTMPHFYSQYLGGTLRDRFEACVNSPAAEQASVYEELALLRMASTQAVVLFNGACSLPDDNERKSELLMLATSNMTEALMNVVKVCESAANIESKAKDKVSIIAIMLIVEQIVRIAYDVFGEDLEKAERFEKMIRETVRLPGSKDAQQKGVTVEELVLQAEKSVVSTNVIEGHIAQQT